MPVLNYLRYVNHMPSYFSHTSMAKWCKGYPPLHTFWSCSMCFGMFSDDSMLSPAPYGHLNYETTSIRRNFSYAYLIHQERVKVLARPPLCSRMVLHELHSCVLCSVSHMYYPSMPSYSPSHTYLKYLSIACTIKCVGSRPTLSKIRSTAAYAYRFRYYNI